MPRLGKESPIARTGCLRGVMNCTSASCCGATYETSDFQFKGRASVANQKERTLTHDASQTSDFPSIQLSDSKRQNLIANDSDHSFLRRKLAGCPRAADLPIRVREISVYSLRSTRSPICSNSPIAPSV